MNTDDAIADVLNLVVEYLKNKYTYGAVGTGDELPSSSDVKLYDEVYRKMLSGVEIIGGNTVKFSFFLDSSEANGYDLKEFGIFSSDSNGLMLCREAIDYLKTSDVEVWIELEEKVEVNG